MSREVRKVPADWKHPVNTHGDFIPLFEGGAAQPQSDWDVGAIKWDEGLRDDFNGGWQPREGDELTSTYVDWCGLRPITEDYMPQWTPEEATHFMMYESCSEGTPISPAFATPEEAARWCADNSASAFADMDVFHDKRVSCTRSVGMSGFDELSTPIYNERGDEDDDELVDPEDFELTEDEEDFEDDDVD